MSSGDYLPTQKMVSGDFAVYGGGGLTDKTHNEYNVNNHTIGIGRVGARCGCVFKINPNSWITDNALFVSELKKDFSFDFLVHYLNFKNLNQFANTAAQPVISLKRISNVTIPDISIEIQNEIVDVFNQIENEGSLVENDKFNIRRILQSVDSLEMLLAELTHQLTLVKQLRQSFLREAMQGKLSADFRSAHPELIEGENSAQALLEKIKAEKEKSFPLRGNKKGASLAPVGEDEMPFEIPEGWVWCRLGEISINKDSDRKPISLNERERKEKIYDYYGASGIIDKIDGYTHDGKYLLIGEDGANLVAKSTPIAFIAEGKFWVNNHAHVLEYKENTMIHFMNHLLNTVNILPYITGGFQPKLSQGNLVIIPIPLPPLSEQQAIVSKLDELMRTCDELEASIRTSQQQNEMLLREVLREALEG